MLDPVETLTRRVRGCVAFCRGLLTPVSFALHLHPRYYAGYACDPGGQLVRHLGT
jgi:hypothetical protein